MEGIVIQKAALSSLHILFRLLVNLGNTLYRRGHMLAEGVAIPDALWLEEAASQNFRDILFEHWLDRLFFFTPQDGRQFLRQLFPQNIALHWVSCQQRGHNSTRSDLGGCLGEILEKVRQFTAPVCIKSHLCSRIHQHFVNQDQGRQSFSDRDGEQRHQQRLCRGALSLNFFIVRIQYPQTLASRQLKGQHAPGMIQPAPLSIRCLHLHPLFRVQLIEGQHCHPRPRRHLPDMLCKLLYRRQLNRQQSRRVSEVIERNQRMCLPTPIRQLQLPDGLIVLSSQSQHHILRQFPQVKRRISQRKKMRGVLVHRLRSPHRHIIQVSREQRERKLARPQIISKLNHFMPRNNFHYQPPIINPL